MNDIQKLNDSRGLSLEKVGIKGIKIPLLFFSKSSISQQALATVDFFTDLVSTSKGTHMSRFVEILHNISDKYFDLATLKKIVKEAKKALESKKVYIKIAFSYSVRKESPVSKKKSFNIYKCFLTGELDNGLYKNYLELEIPVMLLCPCSKAISKYSAHNQRATVRLKIEPVKKYWIEDYIKMVEHEASSELFALLKRPDEKYVTEKSYDNPKFVEDMVRDVALSLKKHGIKSCEVSCESYESIHDHNAYAMLRSK